MSKKKLHFISNDASRTGAPILLFRLIRELVKQDKFSIELFLLNGGPMVEEFSTLAPTHVIYNPSLTLESMVDRVKTKFGFSKLTRKYRYEDDMQKRLLEADIIFANTIVCIRYLENLPLGNQRIFFYIHELQFVTRLLISDEQMQLAHQISETIYVPARYVKDFLVNDHAYVPAKVKLLKYIIPFDLKEKQPVTRNVFSVGACGSVNLRKGFDLFILIIREIVLNRNVRDIHFYWIGVEKNVEAFVLLNNDLKKCGLNDFVRLIEVNDNVSEHLSKLDLFVLTSREDPYPLVVMEAAAHGLPTVYFKDAGGIGEFVGDGGIGVDYLDIAGFSNAILAFRNDPRLLQDCSKKIKDNLVKEQKALDIKKLVDELA